jgi:uncharacterized protein with GYD domain
MATYVILFSYTRQGMDRIKESPDRVDAARRLFREMGAELKQFFLTMGQYDGVVIVEAPDDETMARAALATGSLGNISTETLRAFTEEEFRNLVRTLP